MKTVDYVENLEAALIDILDGQSRWDEIRDQTGCSEERAKEIEDFYNNHVWLSYKGKHGL